MIRFRMAFGMGTLRATAWGKSSPVYPPPGKRQPPGHRSSGGGGLKHCPKGAEWVTMLAGDIVLDDEDRSDRPEDVPRAVRTEKWAAGPELMLKITQECQYALRAVLEVSKYKNEAAVPANLIAEAQAIPLRFLEKILAKLKRAGIVSATRGVHGGYALQVKPAELTVARIIQLIEGRFMPVQCQACGGDEPCPLADGCPFVDLWRSAEAANMEIYSAVTFQDLLNRSAAPTPEAPPS